MEISHFSIEKMREIFPFNKWDQGGLSKPKVNGEKILMPICGLSIAEIIQAARKNKANISVKLPNGLSETETLTGKGWVIIEPELVTQRNLPEPETGIVVTPTAEALQYFVVQATIGQSYPFEYPCRTRTINGFGIPHSIYFEQKGPKLLTSNKAPKNSRVLMCSMKHVVPI
jgi:hypothetical protein